MKLSQMGVLYWGIVFSLLRDDPQIIKFTQSRIRLQTQNTHAMTDNDLIWIPNHFLHFIGVQKCCAKTVFLVLCLQKCIQCPHFTIHVENTATSKLSFSTTKKVNDRFNV